MYNVYVYIHSDRSWSRSRRCGWRRYIYEQGAFLQTEVSMRILHINSAHFRLVAKISPAAKISCRKNATGCVRVALNKYRNIATLLLFWRPLADTQLFSCGSIAEVSTRWICWLKICSTNLVLLHLIFAKNCK